MRIGNNVGIGSVIRSAAQDATQKVTSLVNDQLGQLEGEGGLGSYLGEFAVAKIKDKFTKAMEEFARANPSAKPEELEAKSKQLFNKAQGDELCAKLASDDFMGYMKRRMSEIQAMNAE